MTHHKPCDVILGAVQRPRRRWFAIAGVGALALHAGGAAVALALAGSAEHRPVKKSQPLVVVDHVVDLAPPEPPKVEEPPPPPPPPEAPKPKLKPPPKEKAVEAPAPVAEPLPVAPPDAPEPEKPPSEPPPAAQAAQVVAAEGAGDPAFKIVTGTGSAYAGGTTTASGTGTQANHTGQVGKGNGNGFSKARPVQVGSRVWDCGWPSEADELDVDEMFVTMKLTVEADGKVSEAQVINDPGYGFGKLAARCAKTRVRLGPALDENGNAIRAEAPVIRVRFQPDDAF